MSDNKRERLTAEREAEIRLGCAGWPRYRYAKKAVAELLTEIDRLRALSFDAVAKAENDCLRETLMLRRAERDTAREHLAEARAEIDRLRAERRALDNCEHCDSDYVSPICPQHGSRAPTHEEMDHIEFVEANAYSPQPRSNPMKSKTERWDYDRHEWVVCAAGQCQGSQYHGTHYERCRLPAGHSGDHLAAWYMSWRSATTDQPEEARR